MKNSVHRGSVFAKDIRHSCALVQNCLILLLTAFTSHRLNQLHAGTPRHGFLHFGAIQLLLVSCPGSSLMPWQGKSMLTYRAPVHVPPRKGAPAWAMGNANRWAGSSTSHPLDPMELRTSCLQQWPTDNTFLWWLPLSLFFLPLSYIPW